MRSGIAIPPTPVIRGGPTGVSSSMHTLCLLLALLATVPPTAASADRLTPTAVAADDDCVKATVQIEIDAVSGHVRVFDGRAWADADGDIEIPTGALSHVTLEVRYTEGEWIAAFSADGGQAVRVQTSGGVVRHALRADVGRIELSSRWAGPSPQATAMVQMTPVVPDVIVRPKKSCPPST
jgi:hypothetical protein